MVHFFLFSLYHQYTLSSRWSPENSGRRGIPRFSALHSHSVSHSILLPSNLVFRLMSYVFFSILLSSLFGIAPKSKIKRSSAWKTIDPLYFYTLKLKKLIPSSLLQFGLQTPFNFYGCFKSRVPDPVFRSASLLRTSVLCFKNYVFFSTILSLVPSPKREVR